MLYNEVLQFYERWMMLGPFLWSSRDFGEKTLQFLVKTFFWSSLKFREKSSSIFGEELFFGLRLICLPEKDRGRGSSPQC